MLWAELAAGQIPRWKIAPHPEITIGTAEGDDSYLFESIVGAKFLPDGRIVVADRERLDLRIYNSDGTFQRRLGGPGRGPGEFSQIGGMWLTVEGAIAVWDAANRRITTFGLSNGDVSTRRITENPLGGNLEVFFGVFENGDILLASLFLGERGAKAVPDRWLLGRFNVDGSFVKRSIEVDGMWRFNGYAMPFSPMPSVVIRGDSLFVADGFAGEIAVHGESAALARTIHLPAVRFSGDDIWNSLEDRLRERHRNRPSQFSAVLLSYLKRQLIPRTNEFPQVAGMLTDGRRYLWVKTYDPLRDAIWLREHSTWAAHGGQWRVLRPDGRIVTEVSMPSSVRPVEIEGDRLIGVSIDPLGVQRVVVYRIER